MEKIRESYSDIGWRTLYRNAHYDVLFWYIGDYYAAKDTGEWDPGAAMIVITKKDPKAFKLNALLPPFPFQLWCDMGDKGFIYKNDIRKEIRMLTIAEDTLSEIETLVYEIFPWIKEN